MKIVNFIVMLPLCVLALTAVPTAAQQATPAGQPEPAAGAAPPATAPEVKPDCELHVFPTLEGTAITTGWGVGFGFVGAALDAEANRDHNVRDAAYLKEALGPRLQLQALRGIDIANELKFPPAQVIFETPIADREISTKAGARLTPSTAPCYAELLVTQNFYHKAAIYGRSLNNRFIFKDFRTGKTKADLIKGRGGNGLTHFPPTSTDETEAAELDLRNTFMKNFLEFSKNLHPKP